MKKKSDLLALRLQAERELAEQQLEDQTFKKKQHKPKTPDSPQSSEVTARKLLHELQVHEIELEMQNEELIQSRSETELALQRYTELYDFAPIGYLTFGPDGTIQQSNLAGARLIGIERNRMAGRLFGLFVESKDRHVLRSFLEKVFTSGKKEICELSMANEGGLPRCVQIDAIVDETGKSCRAVMMDVTDRKRAEETIWNHANYDVLTGLPNRRLFRDRLEQEIRNAERSNLPVVLLFIDLDRFKEVNDTFGHDNGDVLLREAAHRIVDSVRESDTVARLGGDEFTVILSLLDCTKRVELIAQSIINKLMMPFQLGEEKAFVSASIGIAIYPLDAGGAEDLLKHADRALYLSKSSGRNRYSFFTHALQEAASVRTLLTNDLRNALDRDQFRVYYQPIVNLETGKICKAEALIRWQHPKRGLVSPTEFIPVAEDTGMIIAIGDWIFREASKQVKSLRRTYHPDFQISVNRSPAQFLKNEKLNDEAWFGYLHGLDLAGQSISIEITERLLLDAGTNVSDKLLAFQNAGIQISIDDFGTGYSSLAYLKRFHIDYLKIDQSFVRGLKDDKNDIALCEAIIVAIFQK